MLEGGDVAVQDAPIHAVVARDVKFWRTSARKFYSTVDWALDISGGAFYELSLRGLPARLVRRDPVTQAVVRRERLFDARWRDVDLSGTWFGIVMEELETSDDADTILVAPKADPRCDEFVAAIERLRAAGIADPD